MEHNKRLVRFLAAFVFCFSVLRLSFGAYDPEAILDGFADCLPEEAREALPEEILTELEEGAYASGEAIAGKLDGAFVVQIFSVQLKKLYEPLLRSIATTVGIVVVAAVLSVLRNSLNGKTADSLHFVISLVMALTIYNTVSAVWNTVSEALTSITVFMRAMMPVMTAIYMAGGNVSTAASSQGMLFALLAVIETVGAEGLYPLMQVCFGMSLISNLTDSVNLSGISAVVRRVFSIMIVFFVMLLGTVLAYQNAITQSADTVLARTVRFAVNSFIPVIGGTAGETVRSVIGSVSYLKTTVGSLSAVTVIVLLVKPFLSLILYKCSLSVASGAAKAMNCDREAGFLDEISGLFDFAGALLAACSLTVLFTLTLFIKAGVAAGG